MCLDFKGVYCMMLDEPAALFLLHTAGVWVCILAGESDSYGRDESRPYERSSAIIRSFHPEGWRSGSFSLLTNYTHRCHIPYAALSRADEAETQRDFALNRSPARGNPHADPSLRIVCLPGDISLLSKRNKVLHCLWIT